MALYIVRPAAVTRRRSRGALMVPSMSSSRLAASRASTRLVCTSRVVPRRSSSRRRRPTHPCSWWVWTRRSTTRPPWTSSGKVMVGTVRFRFRFRLCCNCSQYSPYVRSLENACHTWAPLEVCSRQIHVYLYLYHASSGCSSSCVQRSTDVCSTRHHSTW